METITITKKEYRTLVFAKNWPYKVPKDKKKVDDILNRSFGVLKHSFNKASSVNIVKKMRKAWR